MKDILYFNSVEDIRLIDMLPILSDPYNGFEYVDLGLPSGTKWASCNIGATSPEQYGKYFSWGDINGYTIEQIGTDEGKHLFKWSYYPYGTSANDITKYNDIDNMTTLDLSDDAVRATMGGKWHIPTKEQIEELLNTLYVTSQWIYNYNNTNVRGRLFTSVSDNTKTLFIPASGYGDGGKVDGIGDYACLWSNTRELDAKAKAWSLGTHGASAFIDLGGRYIGSQLRGVVG